MAAEKCRNFFDSFELLGVWECQKVKKSSALFGGRTYVEKKFENQKFEKLIKYFFQNSYLCNDIQEGQVKLAILTKEEISASSAD